MENDDKIKIPICYAKFVLKEDNVGVALQEATFCTDPTIKAIREIIGLLPKHVNEEIVKSSIANDYPVFAVYMSETGLDFVYSKLLPNVEEDKEFLLKMDKVLEYIEADYILYCSTLEDKAKAPVNPRNEMLN